FFTSVVPGWPSLLGAGFGGHTGTEWLSFLAFWSLNIFIIYRGMDLLRRVENWAAPFVLVMTSALLAWAVWRAHGFGPLFAHRGCRDAHGQHRRQRRLPRQRLRQRVSEGDRFQDRRPDHRDPRHRDSALEAAGRSIGVHLHVAARLFGRSRIDCRRADCRLLDRAPAATRARRVVPGRRQVP